VGFTAGRTGRHKPAGLMDGAQKPRSRPKRALITAVALIPCAVVIVAIRYFVLVETGSEFGSYLVSIIIPAALTAWLAPMVSYRRRDAAWVLVGAGLYFLALFVWRATLLPYRDWDPRPDEQDATHWASDPEYGALWDGE
jgi:hypothetical protein